MSKEQLRSFSLRLPELLSMQMCQFGSERSQRVAIYFRYCGKFTQMLGSFMLFFMQDWRQLSMSQNSGTGSLPSTYRRYWCPSELSKLTPLIFYIFSFFASSLLPNSIVSFDLFFTRECSVDLNSLNLSFFEEQASPLSKEGFFISFELATGRSICPSIGKSYGGGTATLLAWAHLWSQSSLRGCEKSNCFTSPIYLSNFPFAKTWEGSLGRIEWKLGL